MIKLTNSQRISVGAMVVALNLLFLYAASVLPTLRIASLVMSSLFVYCLTGEKEYASGIITFIVTSVLALIILPDKILLAPYVMLLGHYGIFKPIIDEKVKDRIMNIIIKIIYCNVFSGIGIAVCSMILNFDFESLGIELPHYLIAIIAEVAFFLWEIIYSLCTRIYNAQIRSRLLPKR